MKTKKLAFAAAAAATLVLGACGNNNDSSGSTESDEIVTELSEDTTVTRTNQAILICKQR